MEEHKEETVQATESEIFVEAQEETKEEQQAQTSPNDINTMTSPDTSPDPIVDRIQQLQVTFQPDPDPAQQQQQEQQLQQEQQ